MIISIFVSCLSLVIIPFLKRDFFDVDHFFKVIIEFVTVLFLAYVLGLAA